MSRKSYLSLWSGDLELLGEFATPEQSWWFTPTLLSWHRPSYRSHCENSLLEKFGIKLILDISKKLLQAHTLLNVACQYHEEDYNPVLDIVIWLRPHTEMIHTKSAVEEWMKRTASTSHPIFLNNPGIVQTQEEMDNLPWSVAFQESKMKSLLPMEENSGLSLYRQPQNVITTKCSGNSPSKSHWYFSLLLIIQRVGNCSSPERKELQMLQCT